MNTYPVIQRFSPLLLLALSACIQVNPTVRDTETPTPNIQATTPKIHHNAPPLIASQPLPSFQLASQHWTDVAKIRAEANRLGEMVREEKLTKVQAAQYLNRFRLSVAGPNMIDDNVYEAYQNVAVERQRGAIDATRSKTILENVLKGWHARWPNITQKPTNPAFTNFLMEIMDLPPLQ